LIHADDLEIDVVIRLSVNKAVAATTKPHGSRIETTVKAVYVYFWLDRVKRVLAEISWHNFTLAH
jgi:hypothetical protein